MCKYCEFEKDRGEVFALDQYREVPENVWFAAETMIAAFLRISKQPDGYYLSQNLPYYDAEEKLGYGRLECQIAYCPFCGRKLEQGGAVMKNNFRATVEQGIILRDFWLGASNDVISDVFPEYTGGDIADFCHSLGYREAFNRIEKLHKENMALHVGDVVILDNRNTAVITYVNHNEQCLYVNYIDTYGCTGYINAAMCKKTNRVIDLSPVFEQLRNVSKE